MAVCLRTDAPRGQSYWGSLKFFLGDADDDAKTGSYDHAVLVAARELFLGHVYPVAGGAPFELCKAVNRALATGTASERKPLCPLQLPAHRKYAEETARAVLFAKRLYQSGGADSVCNWDRHSWGGSECEGVQRPSQAADSLREAAQHYLARQQGEDIDAAAAAAELCSAIGMLFEALLWQRSTPGGPALWQRPASASPASAPRAQPRQGEPVSAMAHRAQRGSARTSCRRCVVL